MNVSIGERWESFVQQVVKEGRYGSASEVIREGLRLVEEREAKLTALREAINASITEGGTIASAQVTADLDERMQEFKAKGY